MHNKMVTKRESNYIKKEDIVNYWKIRITQEKDINTTWDNALTHCWACGSSRNGNLEKCHIIPNCLNGIMHKCNLVLLCKICHLQNPETIYGNDYMLWLKGRVRYGKGDIYIPPNSHPLLIEYDLIYGDLSFMKIIEHLMIQKGYKNHFQNGFHKFLRLNTCCQFKRYYSTLAIMTHKYIMFLGKVIDWIVILEVEDEEHEIELLEKKNEWDNFFSDIDEYKEEKRTLRKTEPVKKNSKKRKNKKEEIIEESEEDIVYGPTNKEI